MLFQPSDFHRKELSKFDKKELLQEQKDNIETINSAAQYLIEAIALRSPSSPDQSAAIRSVRLAAMQANAAIVWDWPEGVE